MHLSHLNSILLDLLSSLDSGHHIGKAVGVNCGVTIAVGMRDSIGGGDSDLGDLDSVAGGDSDPGDGVGGGNHVVVGEVVIGHVVIGKGVVDSSATLGAGACMASRPPASTFLKAAMKASLASATSMVSSR